MKQVETYLNLHRRAAHFANNARANAARQYTPEQKKYAQYITSVKLVQAAIVQGVTLPGANMKRAEEDGYIHKVDGEWQILNDIRNIKPRDIIKSKEVIAWR